MPRHAMLRLALPLRRNLPNAERSPCSAALSLLQTPSLTQDEHGFARQCKGLDKILHASTRSEAIHQCLACCNLGGHVHALEQVFARQKMSCSVQCTDIAEHHLGEVGLSDLRELFMHFVCGQVN